VVFKPLGTFHLTFRPHPAFQAPAAAARDSASRFGLALALTYLDAPWKFSEGSCASSNRCYLAP